MSIDITRRRFIQAGMAVGMLALLPGCNTTSFFKPAKRYGGSLTWAYPNIYSLDPACLHSSREMQITSALYDPLFYYDYQEKSTDNLAVDSYTVSEDELTYVFQLKKDARFHDGSPVRSQDFKYGFERLSKPSAGKIMPNRDLLSPVVGFEEFTEGKADTMSGITCPDDMTLSIKLAYPVSNFILILTHPALVPIIEGTSDEDIARRPVGNGPFVLEGGWDGFSNIKLNRNESYPEPAALDAVTFAFKPQATEAYKDFQRFEYDLAPIPGTEYKGATERFGRSQDGYTMTPGAQCCLGKLASVSYLAFNFDNKLLQHEEIRQAISMSLDRQGLSDKLFSSIRQPADDIIPWLVDGYKQSAWPYCTYDLDRAKELAGQVKEKMEEDQKRSRKDSKARDSKEKDAQKELKEAFTLTLIYNEEEASAELMREIAQSIELLGIDVKLKDLSVDNFVEALYTHKFDIAYTSLTADYPSAEAFLWNLFHSKSYANVGKFDQLSFDKELNKARSIVDYQQRLDALTNINVEIANMAPVAPVLYGNLSIVGSKEIKRATINPTGVLRLVDVTIN